MTRDEKLEMRVDYSMWSKESLQNQIATTREHLVKAPPPEDWAIYMYSIIAVARVQLQKKKYSIQFAG